MMLISRYSGASCSIGFGTGDIIVAGDNFGCGSAWEQAAMTLKYVGIGAVIADSVARTSYGL